MRITDEGFNQAGYEIQISESSDVKVIYLIIY